MSIGSVPWYWAVLPPIPYSSRVTGGVKSQRLKDFMEGGGRGKETSHVLPNCGKDPNGGQMLSELKLIVR